MRDWQRTALVAAAMAVATAASVRIARAKPPNTIDPDAMKALKDMGKYLRDVKTFEVQAHVTDEDVLMDGQKVERASDVRVLAARPNRLRAEVSSDRHQRTYLYDGKTFTLVAPRLNYYATAPAPDTIGELVDEIEEKNGFSAPLVDMFRWDEDAGANITSAIDLGPSVVEGTTCEHYAFRQADVDWQIWIQKGEFPLPRKLVITTRTDPSLPQHTAVYTWNLAPSFNDGAFAYEAPAGMHRVELSKAAGALPTNKKKAKQEKMGGTQ